MKKQESLPISISHLSKSYSKLQAVKDVSFSIKPGEIFGLLGPNGAGKTTIISCIMTLEVASDGLITVFGNDIRKKPHITKSQIGFVPQELIHYGYFNVYEILLYHGKYYAIKNVKSHVEYILKKLDLWSHRFKLAGHLSGGMKRRLLIAKALLHKPKLILLDEPTAGVDIELRNSLWEFIIELQKGDTSILLTTHYLEEAERLCDRIGILQNGVLTKVDTTKRLLHEFTGRKVCLLLTEKAPFIKSEFLLESKENSLTFHIPNDWSIGGLLKKYNISPSTISDIRIHEGDLEDVMNTLLK